jgi:hypothetical protein
MSAAAMFIQTRSGYVPAGVPVSSPARSRDADMEGIMRLAGNMRIVVRALFGLVIGLVFGLAWHLFEPSLAPSFWPVFGALIFGQHAFWSCRDGNRPKPPTRTDVRVRC